MTLARTWLVAFICITVWLVISLDRSSFQTNIFSLLPKATDKRLPLEALDKYSEKLSRRIIFLVSAGEAKESQKLTESLTTLLSNSGLFADIEYRFSKEQIKKLYQFYKVYRFSLLSEVDKKSLEAGGSEWLVNRFLKSLLSPVSGSNSVMLKQDPFGLLSGFLTMLPRGSQVASLKNGFVTFAYDDNEYILVSAVLNGSAFDQDYQDQYEKLMNKVSVLKGKSEIVGYGILNHAIENRLIAQKEITYIGTISLLFIIGLFLLVFRQLPALLFIIFPVLAGAVTALAISLLVFGEIHLVTLVFGASLIGVSVDYTFHYCCANSSMSQSENGFYAINTIKMSLTLGLLTSVIGYLTLSTADFPSLRQMALFSVAGLIGTYLTVILWLPYLIKQPLNINLAVANAMNIFAQKIEKLPRIPVWTLPLMFATLSVVVFYTTQSEDDIRLMRTQLPELDFTDRFVKQVTRESPNSQFFVVTGNTPDQTLHNEQELITRIKTLEIANSRIMAVSQWLVPIEKQEQNYKILYKNIIDNNRLTRTLENYGLAEEIYSEYRNDLQAAKGKYMTADVFLTSDIAPPAKELWLGKIGEKYYSIVSLFGFPDITQLSGLVENDNNTILVDRAGTVTKLMQEYRVAVEKIAPAILIILLIILSLRYGVSGALRVVMSPVLAALASLILVDFIQGHYNLFNIFGLIISIAVAIDYAVFIKETRKHKCSTYLTISLASLTTIVSLGVLALSRTPALHSFGLSLLFGIVFSYVIATFVVHPEDSGV